MKIKLFSFFGILSLMLTAFISTLTVQANQVDGDPQLDAIIEKATRTHNVPGASVAVVKNGEIDWVISYGMANPTEKLPVTNETVFEAASVSKTVTAWGIMKLAEDGVVDLDAPVEQYLTRWHLPPSEFDHNLVTLRRILSHTAGLSQGGDPGMEPGDKVPTLVEALNGAVPSMGALHVAFPPGEIYAYSSIAYSLLELVIEEVTGESFAVYMQQEILNPLGMVNSSFEMTPELRAKRAVGHDWHNNALPEYQFATKGMGGLRTTSSDLAIFIAALMPGPNGEPAGRGILTPESVSETFKAVPYINESKSGIKAGLGYDQLTFIDGTLIAAQKGGDQRGFHTIIVMAPEAEEGIVILTNSDRAIKGFIYDVGCAWSVNVPMHPLQGDCNRFMTVRKVQIIFASVLLLLLFANIAWVVSRIWAGKRQLDLHLTSGKIVRLVLLVIILIGWWVLWYTDTLLVSLGYPRTFVTVSAFVPMATTFIWISWAVTLWFINWIAVTFTPKVKR